MNLFKLLFRKTTWQKVIVEVAYMDRDRFVRDSWDITDLIWDQTQAPMYFARYSGPNMQARIEIKVELDWPIDHYEDLFAKSPFLARVISVEPCEGSPQHAYAYLLSRELRGAGEPTMKDTVHWLYNMSGYSYHQEVRMLCESSATMVKILEDM